MIEFVLGFFMGMGFWFWGLFLIEFCLLTWFVEQEWGLASFVSLAIFIFGIWWLADVPVWTWIKSNPWELLKYAVIYILAGLVWSIGKYYFVLRKIRNFVKNTKAEWMKKKDKGTGMPEGIQTFKQFLDYKRANYDYKTKTDFESSAKKLTFWAAFWPTSMFWTILNDPIRKLFKFLIFDVFIGIFRKMHQKMVGDLIKE